MSRLIYIFFVLIFISCGGDKTNGDILSREKFRTMLIQMHIIEGEFSFNQKLDPASIKKNYAQYESLFKKQQTDSATVANTFDYYHNKQTELLEIYHEVLDSLNAMAAKSTLKPLVK